MAHLSAQLFLHLGPPKTATTALQVALQEYGDSFVYLGKMHPARSEKSVSTLLHDAVAGDEIDVVAVAEALARIRAVLDVGQHAVISEEMLLVDGAVTHQEKLRRLSDVLAGIQSAAIICLRDPVDALPSLYQERYQRIPLNQRLSFGAFVGSNQARVFDYEHLSKLLDGFSRTRVLHFEDLVGGRVTLHDVFGGDFDDVALDIGRTNVGARGRGRRRMPSIRLGDMVKNAGFVPRSLQDKLRNMGIVRSLWRRVSPLRISGGREKDLVVPEELAAELRRKWLQIRDKGA